MTERGNHVLRWVPDPAPVHPIIAELRSRPGEWGVIWEEGGSLDDLHEVYQACLVHRRVKTDQVQRQEGIATYTVRVTARWIPNDEWCCCRGRRA